MKRAYKSTKNRNHKVLPTTEVKTQPEVSFIMVAKGVLGFRESAHIIKVAEKTDCTISIASGKKFGTNKSILSLRRGFPRSFQNNRGRDRRQQLI